MKLGVLAVLVSGLVLAADNPKDNEAKKELEALQGTWQLEYAEDEGLALPDQFVKYIFKGDGYSIKSKGQEKETGTFKLDTTTKPRHMDFTITSGSDKGKSLLGIYGLDGAILWVCMAAPGAPRPTEFNTMTGDQKFLFSFKREKP